MAKLHLGWLQELTRVTTANTHVQGQGHGQGMEGTSTAASGSGSGGGLHDDGMEAALKAYQTAVTAAPRDSRSVSLAWHSCGHYYHVRRDYTRAHTCYQRAVEGTPNNGMAHVLKSLLPEPKQQQQHPPHHLPSNQDYKHDHKVAFGYTYASGKGSDKHVDPSHPVWVHDADASFRKGVLCLPEGTARALAWTGHGDFLVGRMGDVDRAMEAFAEGARLSLVMEYFIVVISLSLSFCRHLYVFAINIPSLFDPCLIITLDH